MGNPPTATKSGNNQRAVIDATAGAISGCLSRLIVAPLDVLKIRFQVQLEPLHAGSGLAKSKYTGMVQAALTIAREEGILGLWRGTLPGQLLTIPYTAVQFITLQQCKLFAKERGWQDRQYTAGVSFLSGAIAGASGTIASYPFDVLRTVLAAQGEPKVYRSMMDAAIGIVNLRGVFGLYSGLGVTLLEIMPYAALQFGVYDGLNNMCDRMRAKSGSRSGASTWQQFVCGLVSGMVAKLVTHPLDVVKKRYQVAGLQRSLAYGARVNSHTVTSLFNCISNVYAQEGWRGFYKGLAPSVLKAAPAAAVTLAAYEFIVYYMMHAATQPAAHKTKDD